MPDRQSLFRRGGRLPAVDESAVPLDAACLLEDFDALGPWIRHVFPWGRQVYGRRFPSGAEYRKHWEVVQAARALSAGGVLRPDAEVLGVGAGTEPTVFWLTNHVRRVFATDLYLSSGWEESASQRMLTEPGSAWEGEWNQRRLVVQHMDALDLRYEDDSFDAIFSSSSIEHFGTHDDVIRSVREAYRVLKPGGVLSVSTELRMSGPGPGLPGILMFDWDELEACITGAAPWEPMGSRRSTLPDPSLAMDFLESAGDVEAHVAEHGEIKWAQLRWSRMPQIVLRHQDGDVERVWTSVHVARRKPR